MVVRHGEFLKRDRGIAQLVEQRSPKPRAEGSNPSAPAIKAFTTSVVCDIMLQCRATNGPVVQLVRTLACHARGRRFEPVPGRHFYAAVAQSVERILGKDEVGGSNPPSSSIETLESQRIQGFSIFWKFVGKPHFPTILPTNSFQELFFCSVAMISLAISGLSCSS